MSERRQFLRLPATLAAKYRIPPSWDMAPTTTATIGGGGASVLIPQCLPYGAEVEIELTLPAAQQPIRFTTQVAWCDAQHSAASRPHQVGLEIVDIREQDHRLLTHYCLQHGGTLDQPPAA